MLNFVKKHISIHYISSWLMIDAQYGIMKHSVAVEGKKVYWIIVQAFFWTISLGTQGAKTSGTLSFFAYFVEFKKNLLSFRKMLSFLREYWVFPTKTLIFSEKSFKFIQYSPAFYKITFFSFNISYPRYIFALQPSLVASKTSGTLSFAENGEENLRYLEF